LERYSDFVRLLRCRVSHSEQPSLKLKTKRDEQGHWFENIDQTVHPWCGPYKSKAEMMEDKLGCERMSESRKWKKLDEEWGQSSGSSVVAGQ
jgi:hypothetical protein